jgi:hypothetical protein
MRLASFAAVATALAFLLASLPAEAESQRARTRITVKKPRSYLDAGTTVKPGTMHYLDYTMPPGGLAPTYGPFADGSWPYARWPLPRVNEIPGF